LKSDLSKIRVFCGYSNTGGIAFKIAEGLRKNGIRADSVVIDDHAFSYKFHKSILQSENSAFLNRLLKYYYFIKHSIKYNVFIFNTRSTLLSRNWDLKILNLLGKKTAMVYIGCDIRDKNFYLNSADKFTVCKNCSVLYQEKIVCIMERKIKESSYIQKHINASFSHPFDSMILNGKFNYLYLLLELDQYKPKYTANPVIKILHAPSDEGIKGTKYVLEAIGKLKEKKINFEFELIKNKTNSETIDAIRNADILIDQMVAGWYGLISIEAMALGKTTVCFLRKDLYNYIPEIPIINLNPDNLAEGLENLITGRKKLPLYGQKGREFVERYHDYVRNSLLMLNKTLISENKI
jgi:hypothetical protein